MPKKSSYFQISSTLKSVIEGKATGEQYKRYYWEEFNSLSNQRAEVFEELKSSLSTQTQPFEFKNFQRIVKVRYFNQPLSAAGSVEDPTGGGRFNIGGIDPARFPPFPALYIAGDKKTALLEKYGQENQDESMADRLEQALTKSDSIAEFSISGKIQDVLDITKPKNLVPLFNLFKNFSYPPHLHELGKEIGFAEGNIVQSVSKLMNTFMLPYWKIFPTLFSVPSNSQILGQIAFLAGIEGILYKSICLFP